MTDGRRLSSRQPAPLGLAACLLATVAIAGCGESSSKTASVATTKPATTPATTSTAAKQPATTPSKTTSTSSQPSTTKTSTSPSPSQAAEERKTIGKIKLTSAAFKVGGPIAVKYTCDGSRISPPLQWHGVPSGTAQLFLLAIDLTGGASSQAIQWAVAGIPPSATGIPTGGLPPGAVVGRNSEGKTGWGGICGAKGKLHRVGFVVYALRHKLALQPGFNPIAARGALKTGATLASGLTLATYLRH